jgi:RNA polymerase primary sigma factor
VRKRLLRRKVEARPATEPAKLLALPTVAAATPAARDISDIAERETNKRPIRKETKPGASDDHLSTYFRDLAEHDLLGPEEERLLSQGIEGQEVLTWERILAHPDMAPRAIEIVEPQRETPVSFTKGQRAAETARERRKDPRAAKRLATVAREAATRMRAADLDRVHVDAVLRDFDKARGAAIEGKPSWIQGASGRQFGEYLDAVRRAHRAGMSLRDEFVRANLRLVVTMARRYDRGGMPLADLIQEGNLGLMHAVSRFDYRRGLRFSTYACWWIRHAIGRALADKARAVRIPVHMLEAQQQLEKVRQALIGELGRPPTPQELAKAARVPLAKLNQMHRYLMGQPMSLDRPVHDDDDRAFGDMLADPQTEEASPADDMTMRDLSQQVSRLLHHLSPIEADVLRKRFGLSDDEERTFREIGDEYSLSRERIRQIQNAALDKLKRAMEREHRGQLEV